ncbi:hypothetical protein Tco_0767031 [Tanacetum coccineum]
MLLRPQLLPGSGDTVIMILAQSFRPCSSNNGASIFFHKDLDYIDALGRQSAARFENKVVIDSRYSRTLDRNRSYLTDYEDIDGGICCFGNQSNGNAGTKACNDADLKSSPDARFKPSGEEEKKDAKDPRNKDSEVLKDNTVDENIVYGCVDDPNMPELEDVIYSDDDEDVGVEADMNNLDAFIPVSPIPTT